MIGYALCGSYCTHSASLDALRSLVAQGYDVLPIVSENVYTTDTRFGTADDLVKTLEKATGHSVIHTVRDAEPLGPKIVLDALLIAPCTGNTLAKIANGISDTAVTMAAKAHLRDDRTTVVALASNDALSANLANIAKLLMRKRVYFTPMHQDDPKKKPHSLVADFASIPETLTLALRGSQLTPIFV